MTAPGSATISRNASDGGASGRHVKRRSRGKAVCQARSVCCSIGAEVSRPQDDSAPPRPRLRRGLFLAHDVGTLGLMFLAMRAMVYGIPLTIAWEITTEESPVEIHH